MTGRRVPNDTPWWDYEPGDYGLCDQVWYARPPVDLRLTGNLSLHEVVEHEDGTITVSPSILCSTTVNGEPASWHGFLERGVWREC